MYCKISVIPRKVTVVKGIVYIRRTGIKSAVAMMIECTVLVMEVHNQKFGVRLFDSWHAFLCYGVYGKLVLLIAHVYSYLLEWAHSDDLG